MTSVAAVGVAQTEVDVRAMCIRYLYFLFCQELQVRTPAAAYSG